jgi:hypothetical protein
VSVVAGIVIVVIVEGSLRPRSLTSGFLNVEVELLGLSAADEHSNDQDEQDHGHYANDYENTDNGTSIIEEPIIGINW